MIVSDTNLIVYLLVDGPYKTLAQEVFHQISCPVVPPFWKVEMLNTLVTMGRTNRLSFSHIKEYWTRARKLELIEEEPHEELVLKLALENHCSAYDCMFVALAMEHGLPLVTFDNKILKKFPKYAIHPSVMLKFS
jgi:predicted nucleic acid-binding protein